MLAHTHEDIDACFRKVSDIPRRNDAETLDDLVNLCYLMSRVSSMFLTYDLGLMAIFVTFGSKPSTCIIDLKKAVMSWKLTTKENMFQPGEILMGDFLEEINRNSNEDPWYSKTLIH